MIVLDTDVLSIIEWATTNQQAQQLLSRLDEQKDEMVATIISLEEQMRGWMAVLAKKKSIKDQIPIYQKLHRQFSSLCQITLLDFDELAAVQFQKLRKRRIRIGTMDLKIGAIALANNATVVTGNTRDFSQIPDLKVIDWRNL